VLPTRVITDPDDPAVASFRGSDERSAVADGHFVVETEHVVGRLLSSSLEVEAVLLTPSRLERLRPSLVVAASRRERGLQVLVAEPSRLTEIVGYDRHRGVAALARRPASVDPLGVLMGTPGSRVVGDAPRTILAAEGIVDPVNIGAILRAARAFAVDLVLLDRRCGDPWSRRASRAAMGNNLSMHRMIARVEDLAGSLLALRSACPQLQIAAATTGPAASELEAWSRRRPSHLAILLGNEGAGISPELIAVADLEVTIPMVDAVDSLNVGMAAAVMLYAAGGLAGVHS